MLVINKKKLVTVLDCINMLCIWHSLCRGVFVYHNIYIVEKKSKS